jgi:nitroreductase
MEAGHAAQNVFLQAVSLELGIVVVGAFRDDEVKKTLSMPDEEHALYILPVGGVKME